MNDGAVNASGQRWPRPAPVAPGSYTWLGLMSGTSCDGIDAARVHLAETGDAAFPVRVLDVVGATLPFPEEFSQLLRVSADGTLADAARWDRVLGESFAAAASDAIGRWGAVDGIAVSGHTFAHLPQGPASTTLQMGNAALVAAETQCVVVSGFRSGDVAVGGEGAPLVPAGDRALFGALGRRVAVINVGGISNVTLLDGPTGEPGAADCGPGNLVLNEIARRFEVPEGFDRDGVIAARGHADAATVTRWLEHPFLSGTARSTGREEFGEAWVSEQWDTIGALGVENALASAVTWIAAVIARKIEALLGARGAPLDRCLIGGGGAHHQALVSAIADATGRRVEILCAEEHGVDADLREAAAFAILGHERCVGRPGSFPATTGCSAPTAIGSIWLPGVLPETLPGAQRPS